jgi:hypothetical protein
MFEAWCAKDPVHSANGITWADVTEKDTEAAVVYDEQGPISIVRFHKALRVAMQFNPDASYRVAKTADETVDWFGVLARSMGMKEVIIRPGGKAVRFAEKLGFKDFIGKFIGV